MTVFFNIISILGGVCAIVNIILAIVQSKYEKTKSDCSSLIMMTWLCTIFSLLSTIISILFKNFNNINSIVGIIIACSLALMIFLILKNPFKLSDADACKSSKLVSYLTVSICSAILVTVGIFV